MADYKVDWWELPVADLAKAKEFYGAVFGWTFQPFGEAYEGVNAPDGTMIGGLDASGGERGKGVRMYVSVPDLAESLRKVVAAGGTVASEPTEIGGDMGWWAAFTDPDGLWIGLWAQSAPAS